MNKKMRELLAKMEQKRLATKEFTDGDNKDLEKAASILDEIDELQKEFDVEKRLFEAEKSENEPNDKTVEDTQKADDTDVDGFAVIAKAATGKRMSEAEKALIVDGEDGENFLIPEDVKLAINELRRQYVSAKDLVTVTKTNTLTGSTNYEAGDVLGLAPLVDGNEIAFGDQPSFRQVKWAVEFFAKMIPVSNILRGAEKAGLMSYLNRWFVKNAIFTENEAIFAGLKAGKDVKAVTGWEALKKSINVDLDPALLIDAVVVTNQTGFAILDEEKDENGRPILQPNPANTTQKLFQGLPVRVFSDAQLANVETKAPIFYGSLKSGIEFIDYQTLQFATSEHYLFNKNQTAIRVIEGFDVIQTDKDAYIYGTFEATPAEVVPAG
ncbi:phage major capsid protein [Jeotgalibaca porci]|uniref:phage major capsid protein n=1 Tax=Jeotgalibaca porci TaxID=1868793 RepID=UPI0035A088B6